jgi:hypothetical protein
MPGGRRSLDEQTKTKPSLRPGDAMGIGQESCRDYPGFECPLCEHRRYYRILVQREQQPPYRTSFFACFGCSTMFTDPFQFTQSGKPKGGNFGSSSYGPAGKEK